MVVAREAEGGSSDAALSRDGSSVGRARSLTDNEGTAAQPSDKARGTLAGGEEEGCRRGCGHETEERATEKRTRTSIYIISGRTVICVPKSQ